MASSNYNRMGFKEEKADVKDTMIEEFTSPLVAELRANGGMVSSFRRIKSIVKYEVIFSVDNYETTGQMLLKVLRIVLEFYEMIDCDGWTAIKYSDGSERK